MEMCGDFHGDVGGVALLFVWRLMQCVRHQVSVKEPSGLMQVLWNTVIIVTYLLVEKNTGHFFYLKITFYIDGLVEVSSWS